jgi:hypothetical protein
MKKILLTTAALILSASLAAAGTVTLATGKEGGGYAASAQATAQRLAQRGYEVAINNMNGSDEISLAVCMGDAQAGWMQIDAIFARSKEGCQLRPVAKYGDGETAFIFFPPNSRYDDLTDLSAANGILVDTVGSGSALWMETAIAIENGEDGNQSEWSKARLVYDPISMADPLASFGDIDAVVLVRTQDSRDIQMLVDNGWIAGDLKDKDIDDQLFKGQPLYEVEKFKFRVGGVKVKGRGYSVKSFVAVTTALASENRDLFMKLAGAVK